MGMGLSGHTIASPSVEKKYDGETIFRGIVFGQGPVARLFPEIWPEKLLEKVRKDDKVKTVANNIMNKMKNKEPKYFFEFERAVYSGDHLKVDTALKEGGKLLTKVIEEEEMKKPVTIEGAGTGQCVTQVAYLVVAISAAGAYSHAVVATAAGAVTVYAAVVAKTTFWTSAKSEEDVALKQEMLINNIVNRLAQ